MAAANRRNKLPFAARHRDATVQSLAVWAKGLYADTSKALLDREMDRPVVREIREVGCGPGATAIADLHGLGTAVVWDYAELRSALAKSDLELPALTGGIGLSFSFRRATRAGPSEGAPIEDVGIAGTPYAMTRADLLSSNVNPTVTVPFTGNSKSMEVVGLSADVVRLRRRILLK